MQHHWYPQGYINPLTPPETPVWKVDSTPSRHGGPSTVRSSRPAKTEERAIFDPPPISDLIDGSTYFKIGEPVYVRRWFPDNKVYSVWLLGKVMRPDFCKDRKGREERRYVVSYWDPRTETQKEKTYSPSLKEITPVDTEMPTTAAIPAAHRVGAGNASRQTATHGKSTVLALLPNTSGSDPYPIWTPALCLGVDQYGYRVRVIAGPSKNQEFSKVFDIMAYNAETARTLHISGHKVERSAFSVER